ncbi:RNA methyltransferase [Alkalihalobacillus alcalophilus ATCC 27647 = CGMCC 1.3604]|uniref:RNA methyltransferase n=1 Tax=Alkalihalobacillus alcalophilus ATCC 27647 = CGMCC 1.3604 TaxID=1218173 RepID=A0A094WIK6_ALKAL|nr:class I SAM-dependent RNA methyltransferase [Alkalihalobacillus alcalophilus]KGA96666.1 RNA methyltransferase [Alkalihalobacillus alcalophilus ATCC 27647 = CGMCC 1.3604]MED1561822.1 class I SAM-dependent RNA methyltransferase [Alkalihalobacillus alcalophilus]THG90988.1 RNA methyltransferase [Alkalihalobacillus alcalophilus ATCC 27647 = CGMCC 1.3604]
MKKVTLIATATMGLEAIVAREVKSLGYEDVQVENGKVIFTADVSAIPRANLWIRTADRIKVKIAEFKAFTFDELFEKTKALPWADYIPVDAEFPVIGKSVKSKLFSVSDCQAIVKKAVVESLKKQYKTTWFDETGSLYRIEVALHKDVATLTLDSSGVGLHKRGYRSLHNQAPLKETMAAAMIMLTSWRPDRPFVDPFCGSGTIPIEAAMIGQNIAPGFNRDFVSEDWSWIGKDVWNKARQEVEDLANYDQKLDIIGSDIDHRTVDLANNNALEAGLGDLVTFKQMQIKDFSHKGSYGVIVGNPPYGERLGEQEEVEQMYRDMGQALSSYDTWSVYMLTSNESFEQFYGKKASKKRKLYNGNIKTDFYQFFGPRPPKQG